MGVKKRTVTNYEEEFIMHPIFRSVYVWLGYIASAECRTRNHATERWSAKVFMIHIFVHIDIKSWWGCPTHFKVQKKQFFRKMAFFVLFWKKMCSSRTFIFLDQINWEKQFKSVFSSGFFLSVLKMHPSVYTIFLLLVLLIIRCHVYSRSWAHLNRLAVCLAITSMLNALLLSLLSWKFCEKNTSSAAK